MTSHDLLTELQHKIWDARIPLEIRIAASECRTYDQVDPYLIAFPRLSYLPTLLPALLSHFSSCLIADPGTVSADAGCFVYETIPLKWHLPVGLLYDIYVLSTEQIQATTSSRHSSPFKLTIHFSGEIAGANQQLVPLGEGVLVDSFINAVKEADFLRSGTAKPIMSLSAADSRSLWKSAQENNLETFSKIYDGLLPVSGQWRKIPLRVYIPASFDQEPGTARVRTLQGHFTPILTAHISTTASQLRGPSSGQVQTLGSALHSLIPSLFPSRRSPIMAKPILHGAQVPMAATLEGLARKCCYADGWINVVIAMTS